jgi:nucleoside phosphorylase
VADTKRGGQLVEAHDCGVAATLLEAAYGVAWEGSGAARAALFNDIGSLEIRGVTDAADKEAPQRFDANLPIAMANLASLLRLWLE